MPLANTASSRIGSCCNWGSVRELFSIGSSPADFTALTRASTRSVGRISSCAGVGWLQYSRRFLDLCRDAGLPLPALNVSVAGFEVDAYWPQARLVAELDSYSFHRSRRSFESDRARDAALLVARCRVIRITHRRLDGEAAEVIQELRSLTSQGYA